MKNKMIKKINKKAAIEWTVETFLWILLAVLLVAAVAFLVKRLTG